MKTMSTDSFLGVFLFCVAFAAAQHRNVHNFKIASWNTNGDRWQSVKRLMDSETIDVMGVQEAGRMPTRTTTVPGTPPTIYVIGHINGRFQEDEWPIDGLGLSEMRLDNSYYLYYFDRTCQASRRAQTKKQNIAIVSKERALEIFLFPPVTRQNTQNRDEAECDDRLFVNRPTIGIRIENSFFFTLHTEPRLQNEADLIITDINQFMKQVHPQSTWILMGDFNRLPSTVATTKLGSNMKPKIISPIQGTRGDRVLDFGIVGGPDQQATSMGSLRVKLLSALNGGVGGERPSDHIPIEFYR